MIDVRTSEKYALTLKEAAAYFHIGEKHLREMISREPNSRWLLWNGTHALIKRKQFEKMLDDANAI